MCYLQSIRLVYLVLNTILVFFIKIRQNKKASHIWLAFLQSYFIDQANIKVCPSIQFQLIVLLHQGLSYS